MAAQKGLEILLKRGDGASPQVFTAFAGLRSKTVTINKEQVDITSADDTSRWRQLLAGASVKSLSCSGSGVLKNDATTKSVVSDALADIFGDWQAIIPNIGTFEGPFQVNISFAGDHNNEATYELSLESAGDIDYAAS